MNIETFDPKTPWPKPDPDFHICMEHQPTMVTYRDALCPLCRAEKKLERMGRVKEVYAKAWMHEWKIAKVAKELEK